MTDRVRHDSASVQTVDGHVIRRGRSGRMAVELPDEAALSSESVVRLLLDETEYKMVPHEPFRGSGLEIRGAYGTAESARNPGSAHNQLDEWIQSHGLEPGRTVHLDIITEGFRYGLRAPGEEAIYPAGRPPTGLQDIAEDL